MVSLGDLGGSIYFESAANISKLQQCEQGGKKEKEKLNIKVMLMPRFLILAFSILTYALGMSVIYGLLPSLGKEWGKKEKPAKRTLLFLLVSVNIGVNFIKICINISLQTKSKFD